MEKLSYFPFTHGDMIERQRRALNDLQKHEQLQEIKDKQNKEKQRKQMQTMLNAQANELMLLSFQREEFEEALQKSTNKPTKRMGDLQGQETASHFSGQQMESGQKKKIGLFLKNGSKVLPPRRQQLPVSNAEIDMDDNESNVPVQNQYQHAMSEAMRRHELQVQKVKDLRKA